MGYEKFKRPILGQDDVVSTSREIDTGLRWTNGKPVYRKAVDLGAMPNQTSKAVNHNIDNIDEVASYQIVMTDGNTFRPVPYAHKDGTNHLETSMSLTQVTLVTNHDWSSFTGKAIVEYTKTTD